MLLTSYGLTGRLSLPVLHLHKSRQRLVFFPCLLSCLPAEHGNYHNKDSPTEDNHTSEDRNEDDQQVDRLVDLVGCQGEWLAAKLNGDCDIDRNHLDPDQYHANQLHLVAEANSDGEESFSFQVCWVSNLTL